MKSEEMQELTDLGVDISSITPESIFRVHLMNIGAGVLMMLIGGFLLYRTRKQKSSGKKTPGWILLALGFSITAIHVIQTILG